MVIERTILRTIDRVVLPADIAGKVDIVTGLTDFFDHAHERKAAAEIRRAESLRNVKDTAPNSAPGFRSLKGSEKDVNAFIIINCQDGTAAKGFDSDPCAGLIHSEQK